MIERTFDQFEVSGVEWQIVGVPRVDVGRPPLQRFQQSDVPTLNAIPAERLGAAIGLLIVRGDVLRIADLLAQLSDLVMRSLTVAGYKKTDRLFGIGKFTIGKLCVSKRR